MNGDQCVTSLTMSQCVAVFSGIALQVGTRLTTLTEQVSQMCTWTETTGEKFRLCTIRLQAGCIACHKPSQDGRPQGEIVLVCRQAWDHRTASGPLQTVHKRIHSVEHCRRLSLQTTDAAPMKPSPVGPARRPQAWGTQAFFRNFALAPLLWSKSAKTA